MQMEATDAFDIQQEPRHILEMYGEGTHARQTPDCAARLVERGVRYVQLWHGRASPGTSTTIWKSITGNWPANAIGRWAP